MTNKREIMKYKWKAVRIREDILEMAKKQAAKQQRSTANYIEWLIYNVIDGNNNPKK